MKTFVLLVFAFQCVMSDRISHPFPNSPINGRPINFPYLGWNPVHFPNMAPDDFFYDNNVDPNARKISKSLQVALQLFYALDNLTKNIRF